MRRWCGIKRRAYFFDVDAFLNIIDDHIERNDPVKALQVVDFAQSQHPTSIDFLLRQAQLLAMVDRTEEALAILDKAEQLTPADPDLHMIRGSIYSSLQQFEKAVACFNQAIPLADELDILYLNLAYVYESWGDYNKAIEYLQLSLEDNPKTMSPCTRSRSVTSSRTVSKTAFPFTSASSTSNLTVTLPGIISATY